jgi:hypothetical protein
VRGSRVLLESLTASPAETVGLGMPVERQMTIISCVRKCGERTAFRSWMFPSLQSCQSRVFHVGRLEAVVLIVGRCLSRKRSAECQSINVRYNALTSVSGQAAVVVVD